MSIVHFQSATNQGGGGKTAVVTPSSINKSDASNGASTYTTPVISCSVSGGTSSSYSWTWQSGGSNLVINSPSSSGTTVTSSGTNTENNGTLKCTIDNDSFDTCGITVIHGTPP